MFGIGDRRCDFSLEQLLTLPPPATGGRKPFPLPGDPLRISRDRTYDLQHIRIEIVLDFPNRHVRGLSTMTLTPINDGLTHIDVDASEMTIFNVAVDGQNAGWDYRGDQLRVDLGRAVAAGEQTTVVISYQATPRRGLYFVQPDEGYPDKREHAWTQGAAEDNRHWFPVYDYPNEKTTSEVIATVPEAYFALSNGRLVSVRHDQEGSTRTYHWSQDQPHAPYLVSLVAGDYAEASDAWDGIPVAWYVPPGREAEGRNTFGNTPDMVRFFSQATGVRYPWAKYAQIAVADFIFGAMENTSATTMTEYQLHDDRAHLDFSSDGIVAHELAHQWFGDLVTCRDWSHAWLNEGFATYFDALYAEHHKGRDEFLVQMKGNLDTYLQEDSGHYRRPIVMGTYNTPMDLFDRHLYEKGSLVLHMLRNLLGDTLWWKAINHYLTKHQHQWVTTADLERAIEEATGRNLDWFFQQWVYQAGHPEYKVEYGWDEPTRLARVKIEQTQTVDHGTPLFRMPVDLRFVTGQGVHDFTVPVHEQEQTFHFALPARPKQALFDPDFKIAKTLEFSPGKDLLLAQLADGPNAAVRIAAADGLAKIGAPDVVAALKAAMLTDPFWAVQAAAARALGQIKSGPALAAALEGVALPHPKARRGVVTALGEWKEPAAADALVRVLEQGDASYYVEASAAQALGKTKSGRAFDVLVRQLEKPSHNEIIRQLALEGLAELKDPRGLDVAIEWSQYGRPTRARERCCALMAKLAEEQPSRKQEVIDRLSELLEDPWLRIKVEAAGALESLKDARAIPALQRQAERDLDGRVVRRAREAIAAIGAAGQPDDQAKKLREDLDKALGENRKLRDRLDALEARLG